MEKNRNYIVAIALSVLVVIAWQFFYMNPRLEQQRLAEQARIEEAQKAEKAKAAATTTTTDSGLAAPANSTAAVPGATQPGMTEKDRVASLAASAAHRVAIDNAAIEGSINLVGGRLDDLKLKNYRETIDKKSPEIELLNPADTSKGHFVELGFVGGDNYPQSTTLWSVGANAKLTPTSPVVLTYKNPAGVTFTRTYAVDDKYMFTVTDKVDNSTAAGLNVRPYGRVSLENKPAIASTYVLHEGFVGILDARLKEYKYTAIEGTPESFPDISEGWIGITDKYWAAAIVPPAGQKFTVNYAFPADASSAAGAHLYDANFVTAGDTIAPGASKEYVTRIFAGAKEVPVIDGYESSLNIKDFSSLIDWGWFYFLTKPMFKLMDFLNKYFGNFGLAILGTTVVVKVLFFPIANRQYASMAKMKMVQPKMEEMKAKFGDDRMGLQTAMMQLYKEEKINPLAGCWPIFLQIPVFFALYKVIYITIEMRHAPFFGWIQDLSAPDPTTIFNLFGLIPWTPPHMLMLGVWPLIMGVTMFLQMRMNPTPPDPTQAMLFTWMPVIFTFMLATFPAGLVIYWAWNNSLSILQQGIIMRRNGAKIELIDNIKRLFERKPAAS